VAPSGRVIRTIRQKAQKLEGVTAIYGMGSYFRGEPFNDVDLVVVVRRSLDLATLGARIRTALLPLSDIVGRRIDITIFTESEFAAEPLRDMASLVPIVTAARPASPNPPA
jgi:predicted nucleotidyltransferase